LHSTAKKDPTRPNLRQVLLVDTSILAEIARQNIHLKPGMLGENITLDGITVMTLPIGTQLEVGETLLEVTEVRNPCYQLNEMHPRLLKAVVSKVDGQVRRSWGDGAYPEGRVGTARRPRDCAWRTRHVVVHRRGARPCAPTLRVPFLDMSLLHLRADGIASPVSGDNIYQVVGGEVGMIVRVWPT
jgi:hypothetical protein